MKFFQSKRDEYLEQAISEVRGAQPDAKAMAASAERVWEKLRAAGAEGAAAGAFQVIRGCADVRALLPAFHKNELPAARALLVEDHLRECVSCRTYTYGREVGGSAGAQWRVERAPRGFQWSFARLALVGAALVTLTAISWPGYKLYFEPLEGPRGHLASIEGQAYGIGSDGLRALKQGDQISDGEFVRTAARSHAMLMLSDGSKVEMNQRAQFAVSATRRNTTIQLGQGSIIVHAAKRNTGHLYVSAPDCTVAVTGTVFSVNSGIKGSRVSVIEGEVHVKHSGRESILHSGEQVATTQAVGLVPVRDEIAWSSDRDQELALLAEFEKLQKKFAQIPSPPARYESKILPLLPADTVLYVGIPNLGDALQQANQIFQDQLAQSPILQQWWTKEMHANQHPTPEELIQKIRTLSQYLGDEVVITMGSSHEMEEGPVLLAEVRQGGLQDFLQNQLASTLANHEGASDMHVVSPQTLPTLSAGTHGMIMLVRQNMLIVGGTAAAVSAMNAQIDSGTKLFGSTDFGQRILNVYAHGTETVVAVNFEEILKTASHDDPRALQNSGFENVKYLIATRSEGSGQGDNRITLEFNGERHGFASWLAAPAPMGSLDYVSANAGAALSVIGKQPAEMMDDVFRMIGGSDASFTEELAKTNAELGLDVRNDLAAALGGEMTVALDGPVLPTPSWKVIIEVNQAGALQLAIEKLVQAANREGQKSGEPASLTLNQEQAGGRTFYTLHALTGTVAIEYDYTFADGYILFAPSRALLLEALATHANGTSLARSASFRAILPSDNQANFSGMVYQNLSPILKPLASQLSTKELAFLQQMAADSKPSVLCAYGESDRIEVAASGKLLDLNPGIMTLFHLLGRADSGAERGTSRKVGP